MTRRQDRWLQLVILNVLCFGALAVWWFFLEDTLELLIVGLVGPVLLLLHVIGFNIWDNKLDSNKDFLYERQQPRHPPRSRQNWERSGTASNQVNDDGSD